MGERFEAVSELSLSGRQQVEVGGRYDDPKKITAQEHHSWLREQNYGDYGIIDYNRNFQDRRLTYQGKNGHFLHKEKKYSRPTQLFLHKNGF